MVYVVVSFFLKTNSLIAKNLKQLNETRFNGKLTLKYELLGACNHWIGSIFSLTYFSDNLECFQPVKQPSLLSKFVGDHSYSFLI